MTDDEIDRLAKATAAEARRARNKTTLADAFWSSFLGKLLLMGGTFFGVVLFLTLLASIVS